MNFKNNNKKIKKIQRQINKLADKRKKKPLLMEYYMIPQGLILNGKKVDFRKENFH